MRPRGIVAALPVAARRHDFDLGPTGSRTAPAFVDLDIGVSRTRLVRPEQPTADRSLERDPPIGSDRGVALPSPQRTLAQVLVGHRRLRLRRFLCRRVGRCGRAVVIGRLLTGLRGLASPRTLSRWVPDGADAVAGQPPLVHRRPPPGRRSPPACGCPAHDSGHGGLDRESLRPGGRPTGRSRPWRNPESGSSWPTAVFRSFPSSGGSPQPRERRRPGPRSWSGRWAWRPAGS